MTEEHKVNTYTMYVTPSDPAFPVHYEMLGYDTLFGSHYDKYEVDYADYSPRMPPVGVFDLSGLFACLPSFHGQRKAIVPTHRVFMYIIGSVSFPVFVWTRLPSSHLCHQNYKKCSVV